MHVKIIDELDGKATPRASNPLPQDQSLFGGERFGVEMNTVGYEVLAPTCRAFEEFWISTCFS